eukprot:TRINITY_DN19956_c0_g1_i3.p1 TRINITY_DN19956_c0_g1~~TRINITY_DN19956_c0_g1_i3.p1  ORF type:complete len:239 (-),score=38.82 TRINITY_DN19956_c0_g1_i3:78-746(-)
MLGTSTETGAPLPKSLGNWHSKAAGIGLFAVAFAAVIFFSNERARDTDAFATVEDEEVHVEKKAGFSLPSFFEGLPPNHTNYDDLYWSATNYALKPPGQGGVNGFKVVRFKTDTEVYRIYGSNSKCVYWWSVAKPRGGWRKYLKANAICPEWNGATSAVKCTVPAGTPTVVGPTQSATCKAGNIIEPSDNLQLNGNVCGYDGVKCESCELHRHNLQKIKCFR